jgi:hypothetical protein
VSIDWIVVTPTGNLPGFAGSAGAPIATDAAAKTNASANVRAMGPRP